MDAITTGIITAVATLLVCLVNNYYQNKRESANRDEKHKEQINAIQSTYTEKMDEIRQDYSTQVDGLSRNIDGVIHSIEKMGDNHSHALELINLEIKTLSERQQAYNSLQARTYALERTIEVQEEKIKNLAKG